MGADKTKSIMTLSSGVTQPLLADVQYFDLYSSSALNRKLKNIVLPGFYCGFEPVPGTGLSVRITSENSEGKGAASVDVNNVQISVQQIEDVIVSVKAGATNIIVLEANFEHGVKTIQVDSTSSVSAARIYARTDNTIGQNQIELCRVVVPSGATAVTKEMIVLKYRVNRAVGVEFSNEISSTEERKAATPLAVKTLHDLVDTKAPIDSPHLKGIPTAPTAEQGTNSTQIANAAFVKAAITALINGAPGTLDTLKEIAAAINNDPNFSTTINNALALKAPLASPALTGVPTAPTAGQGTNNTQIATTAYVRAAISALINGAPGTLDTLKEIAAAINNDPNFSTTINNALALKAPLASPALTGVPTAPTAAQGTNNTQIATTAYVRAAISALVGSSPEALDTLNELAEALGNDPNFATTMTNALAGKQPLDATLTALAGLATGANKLPYFTGKDTVAQTDLTSVGRDILAKTSVLAVIQYLGLRELGTSGEKLPLLSTANTWSACQTFNGGITGALTGNADTATKLKTARKINNVSFDGSADITLTASDVDALSLEDSRKIIQPLPDVWIPFNDSLDMITGFSPSYKKIVIGDDEITMPSDKVVKFKRASKATYINKSGVLTEAAIDEPRFERDGLLIEGQRTNLLLNSTNPSKWNKSSNLELTEISTDSFNFTYGRFTVKDTLIGQTSAISIVTVSGSKGFDVTGDEKYVTISCRVRSDVENIRCRLRFEHHDGSTYTFLGDAYLNLSTLLIEQTGGAANRIIAKAVKDEATGWIFFQATINALDTESMIGAMVQYAPVKGSSTVSGDYLDIATPQVEGGSSASSFILTDATATTRASDIVTLPCKNNMTSKPLTCMVEVNKNWSIAPNSAPRIYDITGFETKDDAFVFAFRNTAGSVGTPYVQFGNQISFPPGNYPRKIIAVYRIKSDGKFQAGCNGVLSTPASTTWKSVNGATGIRIGGQTTAGLRHLFGHIRNFRIWHKALTDQQMAEVI
ncbi:phage head spike fiber domain-containing protein [Escherichia coli]|uniref:phage head spike fiber domain-containing protein n=1 Tax=Escherichia coli TaxID=562 RepID=UPI0030C844AF